MKNIFKTLAIFAGIIIACLILFEAFFLIGFSVRNSETDSWYDMHSNTLEYPLRMVDTQDDSSYLLVKCYWPDKCEIVTDTQAIKKNVSLFKVYNFGSLYGTTADGYFELYMDGERIDLVIFDHSKAYTPRIIYGTLRFREIDTQQYLVLTSKS